MYQGFHMSHQGLNDKEVQEEIVRAYHALCPELVYTSPALVTASSAPAGEEGRGRTVVGFISMYFGNHSIGRIFVETILFLAAHFPELDIYVFFIDNSLQGGAPSAAANGSKYFTSDYILAAMHDHLGDGRMIHLSPNLRAIRHTLSHFRPVMDILVFTDVGMDILSFLLSSSRFAYYQVSNPCECTITVYRLHVVAYIGYVLQMLWWGHPITAGMVDSDQLSIDYFLSLDVEVPLAGSEHYSEQLVRMEYMNTARYAKEVRIGLF